MNIAKFLRKAFLTETSGCIYRPSLLNQKQCGMVSTEKGRSAHVTRYLHILIETIPTRFYWLTRRNQKLVQSKPLQQRLFVLILGFWQCRLVFVHYLMSNLMICKLTRVYIYQVASSEFHLAAICSEKESTQKFPFYRNK